MAADMGLCRPAAIAAAFVLSQTAFCLAQDASPILPGGNARGPISILAPTAEFLDKEHKLVYSGGVIAKQGDATLKASTLTVLLNENGASAGDLAQGAPNAAGGNQIKRIEAAGPVTITSRDQVGSGDSGVYERATNRLTLTGNVTLSDCANVMKGARLVYDLTAGRAQVQGGSSTLLTPGVSCNGGAPKAGAPAVKPARPAQPVAKPRQ